LRAGRKFDKNFLKTPQLLSVEALNRCLSTSCRFFCIPLDSVSKF